MRITVKLIGGFIYTVGFSEKQVDVAPGTTAAQLLATFAIDPARPMIIGRNGHAIHSDEEIREGDRIVISPVFSGGTW
jgi:sulfur carrier protein ThiS